MTHHAIEPLIAALKAARKLKKLSQSALASKAGVPQSHLSKIEKGKVNPRLAGFVELARLADLEVMLVPRKLVTTVENLTYGQIRMRSMSPDDIDDEHDRQYAKKFRKHILFRCNREDIQSPVKHAAYRLDEDNDA